MDVNFWLQKWERGETGFHEAEANPLLVKYFKELSLDQGSRVFLPLCGKTLDIAWLLSEGHRVAGSELSRVAIEQLFDELGVEPSVSRSGRLEHFSAKNIDIFAGDIFDLSSGTLGPVDAVYDRAALVALPEDMRRQYASHLVDLTSAAPQLLLSYEYDQDLMDGPPFSVSNDEVTERYRHHYTLGLLESVSVPGGLKGKCAATERVWRLAPRDRSGQP